MKVTLEQGVGLQREIVIRYDVLDEEIRSLLELLNLRRKRLTVRDGDALTLIDPAEVLYCESVDERTYAYTAAGVYGLGVTLAAVADAFAGLGFFRCSKSMAVNLHAIRSLKSGDYGRIFATLANGEKILVSRRYAKALRNRLKGE